MARLPNDIPDAALRVLLCPRVGPRRFAELFERFGSFEAICDASARCLSGVRGISRNLADDIVRGTSEAPVDEERAAMDARGVKLVLFDDDDFPALLAAIPDPPVALWVRGELVPEDAVSVAIVGSRRCTAYGRDQTSRLSSLLAQSGLTILSGGARGIDGEAHRAAVRVNGRTIVVCGCGLEHVYPPEHADLFDRIAGGFGAVVSEYAMSTQPRASFFPRRNRIISGMSLGVLVIEAGKGSGALITAKQASEEHNREVMALPGPVDSPASRGCLEAIRDGWAGMVLDHADVMLQLECSHHLVRGAFASTAPDGASVASGSDEMFDFLALKLTDDQRRVVACLQQEHAPLHPDELATNLQLPMSTLLADLTLLQIRGVLARRDGRIHLCRRGGSNA